MGICSSETDPSFGNKNNNSSNYPSSHKYSTPLRDNGSTMKLNKDVYKISRGKKNQQHKIGKVDYSNNIISMKDNNTNYSTTSKSQTKNNNPQMKLNKVPTMKTINSYQDSNFNDFNNLNDNDIEEFNENFYKNKKKIRRKVHPSEKSLNIISEETLKKMKEEKLNNGYISSDNCNKINYRCIQTIKAHGDKISCMTQLMNNNIASGSNDNTIKIWRCNNNYLTEESTLKEQSNVNCILEFENNMLLSGTKDSKINLWDLNNLNLSYSFIGHESSVNALTKINIFVFASCSNDKTIRIWNYPNKSCTRIINGHLDGVLSLIKLSDGKLCSGGGDLSIKIWNWATGDCCSTLLGHKKWIKCLCQLKKNNFILSGSDDKTIKVWSNNECYKTLQGHTRSVRTICQINDYYFASGSFDKSIKIWEIINFDCVQTIDGHNDLILAVIKFNNNGNIISCSNDHLMKVWENKDE